MNQITMMGVVSHPQQTFWSVKSSVPFEALLSIKLGDAMEFQQSYAKPSRMMPSSVEFNMSARLKDAAVAVD